MTGDNNYYKITLSYEIPYNVLDSQDPSVIQARDNLYQRLQILFLKSMKDSQLSLYYINLKIHIIS